MRLYARVLTLFLALLIGGQAVVVWSATGRAAMTTLSGEAPDAASLAELFTGTGLDADAGPMPAGPEGFRLGLLPGGLDARAVSVLTIAGPALLIAFYALAGGVRPIRGRAGEGKA